MILYICTSCYFTARVLDDPANMLGPTSDTWTSSTCPRCESASTLVGAFERDVDTLLTAKLRITDLTDVECFNMLHGGGLPEEGIAPPELVKAALLASPVEGAGVEGIPGTMRTIITHLILRDGTRLYLAASPQGALVYRLARRESP